MNKKIKIINIQNLNYSNSFFKKYLSTLQDWDHNSFNYRFPMA